MSDIDSKKDNSTNIGDYGKKIGSSIFKFCVLILIGCLVLYASKACGTGILEVIMQSYYIKGLTDDFLLGPVKPCHPESEGLKISKTGVESTSIQSGGDKLDAQPTNVEAVPGPHLNTQYINRIKVNDNFQYQEISFSPNPDIQESPWSSLNKQLNKIREQIKNDPENKNPPKAQAHLSCFTLFITGIISNVTIFNLKLLNAFFKFLNKYFPDSATIIFGPFIAAITLFIIAVISIFVTGYYIVYNSMWLVLNSPSEVHYDAEKTTWNSHNFINGVPIFYKPWKKLLFLQWLWWLGWCVIVGYAVAISIMPVSIIITIYILFKWIIYLLFLPSTYKNYDKPKPCTVFSMFCDSFIYKRPLISSIMSFIVISTSFDVFDTTGGAIAMIVCLLIYFKIILNFELFDEYIPDPVEMSSFVEKPEMVDFLPECVAEYADMIDEDAINQDDNGNADSNKTNETTNASSLVKNKDSDASGAIEMTKITPTGVDVPPIPSLADATDATDAASGAIEMTKIAPTGVDVTEDASIASNSDVVPPVNIKSQTKPLINK